MHSLSFTRFVRSALASVAALASATAQTDYIWFNNIDNVSIVSPLPSLAGNVATDPSTGLIVMCRSDGTTSTWNGSVRAPASIAGPMLNRLGVFITPVNQAGMTGILCFGGLLSTGATSTTMNDTWLFRGGVWIQIQVANPPGARWLGGCTTVAGQPFLFGGSAQFSGPQLGDLWTFAATGPNTGVWLPMAFSGPSPSPRTDAQMSPLADGRLMLFGGNTAAGPNSETWILGANWTQVATATSPGFPAVMAYDSVRGEPVVASFGAAGAASFRFANATQNWVPHTSISPFTAPTSSRAGMAFDAIRGECVVVDLTREIDVLSTASATTIAVQPLACNRSLSLGLAPGSQSPRRGTSITLQSSNGTPNSFTVLAVDFVLMPPVVVAPTGCNLFLSPTTAMLTFGASNATGTTLFGQAVPPNAPIGLAVEMQATELNPSLAFTGLSTLLELRLGR